MRTLPRATAVLRLGLYSLLCSALLLSPAWAGQTYHLFKSDGVPLRAAPSTPKAPAVRPPQVKLPAPPNSTAKVPAVMMDTITKKSNHQQAEGDPDRPLVTGNVYNQGYKGQAGLIPPSKGLLKIKGTLDDGTYKPGEGASFDGKIKDKSGPGSEGAAIKTPRLQGLKTR